MKKLFLAVCFNILLLAQNTAHARIVEVNQISQTPSPEYVSQSTQVEGMPNPQNTEEVIDFFKNRFENAATSHISDIGDLSKSDAMSVQHSAEYIAQMQEQNKSTFEKIYDQAMKRISGSENEDASVTSPTTFYELAPEKQQAAVKELSQPNIPVVNVTLPTGRNILAPAKEHIPYILASFNILPSGLIQVREDITVVANGQKLKHGLIKVLPKFSKSRAGVEKKLDIQLMNVSVNGKQVPYVLEEIGNNIYIKPQQEYSLQPGVYNYTFNYLVDRKLWYYDDFTEFYWDVAGSYLNLVVTSANAIVSIPDGKNFLSQNVIIGYPKRLSFNRAVVAALDTNALGFASTTPLLPAEGMYLLVSLDKNVFMEPGASRRFVWFVTDYGDILFAFAGLAAVLISYILSWKYLQRNKLKLKTSFKQTAPISRFLLTGKFDKTAFVASLLDMYKKNIIDIQKQDGSILLIKKTDDMSTLSRAEKNVINNLFLGKESVITANDANMLKFNRAENIMEKSAKLTLKMLSLQLNIGYLLFSIGMLILTEIAIAYLGINPLQTGLILFSSTLTIAFYIWVLNKKYKSKITGYALKTFAAIFIVLAVLFMSIYIKLISSLVLAGIVYVIFEYSELFMKRSSTSKNKTKEIDELRKYLESNVPAITYGHEFINQQANIFALDLCGLYPKNEQNGRVYKLDIALELVRILS